MTISVKVFDDVEIKEDQRTEFKTSIFIDPEKRNIGFRQLNELDRAKFDALPDLDFFKKHFVRIQPRKKYADCYAEKLGTAANVRAQKRGGKVYFTNPDYVVRRLLAHFGIELSRVALRA